MAGLSLTLIGLHRFQPCFQIPHTPQVIAISLLVEPRLPSNSKVRTSQKESPPEIPSKDINRKVAIVPTIAALGFFLFTRLDFGVSLEDLSGVTLPYEQVNFVTLNLDNTKWEQELHEFYGNEEGNVVGTLPRHLLLENVHALAHGEKSVPDVRVVGQYSSAEARKVH
ncbi:unnamed protein product [Lupinus luteus]|uniref:Uncharacterized protein n=1 Tax=Lupinus luteus TaxID=3873 RepID=A0AAV1WVI9_LUPLU